MLHRRKTVGAVWRKLGAKKLKRKTGSSPKTTSTDGREWLNMSISFLALVVALISALFTYQANQLHAEHLTLDQRHSDSCEIRYYLEDPFPHLDLCWNLLISNQSEDRAVVTSIRFQDLDIGKYVERFSAQTAANRSLIGKVETLDGHITTSDDKEMDELVKLDGGDAQPLVARIDMPLSDEDTKSLKKLFGETDGIFNSKIFLQKAILVALNDRQQNPKAKLDPISLCGYLKEYENDKEQTCRKHFKIEITTSHGTHVSLLMGLPERL
ncbi:hypothetical protein [Paraburkholderia tropica]|uniref:hypothetical protein n=1 Tax=Paraburkholderia tropica TaxID=92647 RepID=UPI002ABE802D|nr:hypothetical protein [Paraburkholderia tropica]